MSLEQSLKRKVTLVQKRDRDVHQKTRGVQSKTCYRISWTSGERKDWQDQILKEHGKECGFLNIES